MNRLSLALTAGIFAAAVSSPAFADAIPYGNAGTIAPTVATFSTGNGINVYFYNSNASFNDNIQVLDTTSGFLSAAFFPNHATSVGDSITIGAGAGEISSGDALVFLLNSPTTTFGSDAAFSSDGINHAYITTFGGGTVGSTVVPAGLFVGLEDEPKGSSDLDYNDDSFIFTGVSAPSIAVTPEPSSLVLLGTGLLGIAGLARRRFQS